MNYFEPMVSAFYVSSEISGRQVLCRGKKYNVHLHFLYYERVKNVD